MGRRGVGHFHIAVIWPIEEVKVVVSNDILFVAVFLHVVSKQIIVVSRGVEVMILSCSCRRRRRLLPRVCCGALLRSGQVDGRIRTTRGKDDIRSRTGDARGIAGEDGCAGSHAVWGRRVDATDGLKLSVGAYASIQG